MHTPRHAVFTTTDSLIPDPATGATARHFVLVHVLATVGPDAVAIASDDAAACAWVALDRLSEVDGLIPKTHDVMRAVRDVYGGGDVWVP